MPSPSLHALKSTSKISCLECRAVKRRCSSNDTNTRCSRCIKRDFVCEYKEHHRGRKKKRPNCDSEVNSRGCSVSHPLTSIKQDAERLNSVDATTDALQNITSNDISFSHVVPVRGDSWPYLQRSDAASSDNATKANLRRDHEENSREHIITERLLASTHLDPVDAGLLTLNDANTLFSLYFSSLNLLVPILDPELHTAERCKEECPLLFTAVLTITSKAMRPNIYRSCLLLSNRLIGQVVERSICSVGVVQAIHLLVHFKEQEDESGWRRIGYAIRMAQEMRLNELRQKDCEPPENTLDARLRLNRERTWLNLLISDYHMAIHYSLPRMITEDVVEDPDEWVRNHPGYCVRGENLISPLIKFSRMCRFYADILESMNGDPSNMRLLTWVEGRWQNWRRQYLENSSNHVQAFEPLQIATLRLCNSYFTFHLSEYRLLFYVRYPQTSTKSLQEPTNLSLAFNNCVEAAFGPSNVFCQDFSTHDSIPFTSNILWVALAVTCIWLVRNRRIMGKEHRKQVLETLDVVQKRCKETSRTSADFPAYMHRLLLHLLPELGEDTQSSPSTMDDLLSFTELWPKEESARQIIQEHLWTQRLSQPPLPTDNGDAQSIFPGHIESSNDISYNQDNFLFPSDDDEFWKYVFPVSESSML